MPIETTNYKLVKPLQTEDYNVDIFNGNADIIDTKLKERETQVETHNTSVTAHNDIRELINDLDAEVVAHKADYVTSHNVSRGTSSFAGSGQEVTIPHGLPVVPKSAYAFPTTNPAGYLGEVWIRMDNINLYIGNSGSFTGAMCWTAIG